MTRKITALLLAFVLVLSLVACGSGASSSAAPAASGSSPAASADDLQGEIVFWHSFTQGLRLETLQKIANDFMAIHPGVKITMETFSWGDFYTKWTTGFSSGNLPDMSSALPNHVVEMIEYDAIVPLDDMIDRIGRDRFFEAPLKEMTKDGVCYAVPLYSHAQVLWYRKDLLEKYNLEVPTTWAELKEAADTITKGENGAVYGCSVPMGVGDVMAARFLNFYVRSAGETLLKEDGTANLTSPAVIDGINYWLEMYRDNSPAESINYVVLDQATLYYQGKTAFDFNCGFQIGGVQENRPDLLPYIDCAPLPTIEKGAPQIGYETSNTPIVVWKNSKHPEICEAFIEFLYQPENYIPFLESVPVGMLPALKDIAEDERFLSNPIVQQFQHAMEVITTAMGTGTAIGMENGPVPEAGLLTSQHVIEKMFQDIIINNTPVEQAAKNAEDTLNEIFETLH